VRRSRIVAVLPLVVLFAVALGVRLRQHHDALLYPDGYQYLLMARGIGEHLQPTTTLGPGGDVFTPSPDAAAKPLFPALVAVLHAVGLSWLEAARLVTALAAAWVATVVALLVSKLSGSNVAGAAAAVLVLASPSLGLWSGFSGPDPLAQALVLTAALMFVDRRPRLGGVLTGLAIAARPEIVVLAIAAGLVALRSPPARRHLRQAAPAAVITATLLFALLRAPFPLPDWRLLVLVPLFAGLAAFAVLVPIGALRYMAGVALGLAVLALVTWAGPAEVWRADWPLLVAGAAGFVVLIRDRERCGAAIATLGAISLLGTVYVLKNPGLARYFSLVLPGAAVLAGVAVAALPRGARPPALGAIAAAAVFCFLHPVAGSRDYDMFPVVAKHLERNLDAAALVTAAPDAYGFWLPTHAVRGMRPGESGAVLLDAAQRFFQPDLTARGSVVARLEDEVAFARPDREIDAKPVVLVAGEVVPAADPRRLAVAQAIAGPARSDVTRPEGPARAARRFSSRAAGGRSRLQAAARRPPGTTARA
jgi:hypothetical protein